jgi:YfiH family protein
MKMHDDWIDPALPVPGVRAVITTRSGGVSSGAWAGPGGSGGMNLGFGSGDASAAVEANRARLRQWLPQEPKWLRQVHGARVVAAESVTEATDADASTSVTAGTVCAVLVADCVPVLLASRDGRGVAAAHAGWRGLAGGVIQNTAVALRRRLNQADAALVAYLGPAIGPTHFEVGPEVLDAMRAQLADARAAFAARSNGRFLADLFALARMALAQAGVDTVLGGGVCTFSEPARFYSFRRAQRPLPTA